MQTTSSEPLFETDRQPPSRTLASRGRRAVPPWVLKAAGILLLSRLMSWAVLIIGRPVFPFLQSHATAGLFSLKVWDSYWYEQAAQHGWPQAVPPDIGGHAGFSTLAFFPAFPELIRAVHLVLPVSWHTATAGAELLSEIFMVVAFWALAREIWDDDIAGRATLLLCFFPGAFVFALEYAEPLFLACSMVALLALYKRRWITAGVFAALATVGRPSGVALIACCAWAALWAIQERREWRSLVAVVIAPVGVVGWFVYLWLYTGVPLIWLQEERRAWGERSDPLAVVKLVHDWVNEPGGLFTNPNYFLTVGGTILALALLGVLIWVRPPGTLTVFTGVILIVSITSLTLGLRPRFVLTAFPLLMTLAVRLKGVAFTLVTAASAMTMAAVLLAVAGFATTSAPGGLLVP